MPPDSSSRGHTNKDGEVTISPRLTWFSYVSLWKKNITIIRSKQTNIITNAEKAKVWKEITDSVNARAGGRKKIGRAIKEKWSHGAKHVRGHCAPNWLFDVKLWAIIIYLTFHQWPFMASLEIMVYKGISIVKSFSCHSPQAPILSHVDNAIVITSWNRWHLRAS